MLLHHFFIFTIFISCWSYSKIILFLLEKSSILKIKDTFLFLFVRKRTLKKTFFCLLKFGIDPLLDQIFIEFGHYAILCIWIFKRVNMIWKFYCWFHYCQEKYCSLFLWYVLTYMLECCRDTYGMDVLENVFLLVYMLSYCVIFLNLLEGVWNICTWIHFICPCLAVPNISVCKWNMYSFDNFVFSSWLSFI